MQRVPRLVAGILHCTCQSVYIEAVVAQELNISLARGCGVPLKLRRKYFVAKGPPRLVWKGMNCSVCIAR